MRKDELKRIETVLEIASQTRVTTQRDGPVDLTEPMVTLANVKKLLAAFVDEEPQGGLKHYTGCRCGGTCEKCRAYRSSTPDFEGGYPK